MSGEKLYEDSSEKPLGENLPESVTSMLCDFSTDWTRRLLQPSRQMLFGQLPITLHELKGLPPQTGFLRCSDQCYELALDGDGLRIVRQFSWRTLLRESQLGSPPNNSEG